MFSATDTIVAIATPPGRGGIGVVRISGPDAARIASALAQRATPFEPRHATLVTLRTADAVDRAIVTYFPEPASYTGEHVVEISAHGSPVVLRAIVAGAIAHGARVAAPGEFTLRAFLNARIDLAQAEAIGDLVDAATPRQARAAFDQLDGTLTEKIAAIDRALFDLAARLEASVDFPDEGYHFVDPAALRTEIDAIEVSLDSLLRDARRGRLLREGLRVVIAGPPNAGKSRLFNALVGADRAIVADVPGTTRDLVTEATDIEGIKVTLVDTAGLRHSEDIVEAEGVSRSRRALDVADLILNVSDLSHSPSWLDETPSSGAVLRVGTKSDLPHAWTDESAIPVSAVSGEGLDALRANIAGALDRESRETPAITNVRHIALVERARNAVARARAIAGDNQPMPSEEFLLADLQDARIALEEVTGARTSDDVLAHIFSTFCIGK